MSLSLSDALSHYRHLSDTTHKFWAYFQAIAIGSAAFAWSRNAPGDAPSLQLLFAAFLVFAVLNWRLVTASQSAVVAAARCLKNHASGVVPSVPGDLKPMIDGIKPDRVIVVGLWHAGLSLATLGIIGWRYCLLSGNGV
ncbi:MAG: hypothetical protein ACREPE_04340 [Lysobacter sp.]